MRQLLYVSQGKLASFSLPSRRLPLSSGELELSIPGARVRALGSSNSGSEADVSAKLSRVAKRLRKCAKISTDPSLAAGEWFSFDQEMSCGRANFVSSDLPDLALFHPGQSDLRAGGLVLCGSAGHLTAQLGQPTLCTSNLGWLFKEIDKDEQGYPLVDDAAAVVAGVQRVVRRLGYDLVRLRLSGLAQALYVCPPTAYPRHSDIHTEGRLVLGTPLYVEVGPWNPKW